MKRVLSCIQPTSSRMHIGNYFGAVANWVKLQDQHECFFGIVDQHATTMPYNPDDLKENTWNMVFDLIACGIDPEKSTLFIQSLVPEHTELGWILGCLCPYGELSRMTQFKDKSDLLSSRDNTTYVSSGLFTYPVLQAADILIYKAHYVPVGKDQEQHLELSRVLARRFNSQFKKDILVTPKTLFTEAPKIMSLSDPEKKMSKSLGDKHFVALFDSEKKIGKKIKSAVTDLGEQTNDAPLSPGLNNLFEILKACGEHDKANELLADYRNGNRQYGFIKVATADAVIKLTNTIKERKQEIMLKESYYRDLVYEMSAQARNVARQTLDEVRDAAGYPKATY